MMGTHGVSNNLKESEGRKEEKCSSCSSSFASKVSGPIGILLEVLLADCWSGITDGLDKILQHKWWLEELICFDIDPCHFHRALVAGRAGSEFLGAVK